MPANNAALPEQNSRAPILAAIADVFFLTKVLETARKTGVEVESVGIALLRQRILEARPRAVILDLNDRSGNAIEVARAIKSDPATSHTRVLGFLSHVQADLAADARRAGLDQVMVRSVFTRQLPEILAQLAEP